MNLSDFFNKHPKVALAFSGGVDSSYLLFSALKNCADVHAYCIRSAFQPAFELADAIRLSKELDAPITFIEAEPLSIPEIAANSAKRCYYCKKYILSLILAQAAADGYTTLIDGTNATDDANDRPGTLALAETKTLSPLRECGLGKADIRRLSREAGLFTWNKPAYACLATRVPCGVALTKDDLAKTERAESFLSSLGFSDFRVRLLNGNARIQLNKAQLPLLLEKRTEILQALKNDYSGVTLDLEARDE